MFDKKWQNQFPGAALLKFADSVVLKNPDFSLVADDVKSWPWFIYELQEKLRLQHERHELLLPNLKQDVETIAIYSDYGGEHKGSGVSTYSFLICAFGSFPFEQEMASLRARYKLDKPFKEIKFKDLRHGPTGRILPHYLACSQGLIVGLMFTLVVDSSVDSIFTMNKMQDRKLIKEAMASVGMEYLGHKTAEKLLRIIHVSAYLTALLSREGQKVFWMTDHDAIASNKERHRDTLNLFSRMLQYYSPHSFQLVGGAVPFQEKSASFLDYLSLPDLVAGAVEQYMTKRKLQESKDISVSDGCASILRWLCNHGLGLKKHTMSIGFSDGKFLSSMTKFNLVDPPDDALYIPIEF